MAEKKHSLVLVGLAGVIILLGAGYVALRGKQEPNSGGTVVVSEESAAHQPEVTEHAMKSSSDCYSYVLTSDILVNPAPMSREPVAEADMQRISLRIAGTMNRRDLGEAEEEPVRYVGYQLSDVSVMINGITNRGLASLYGRTGIAVCGPAGHMLHFCLPAVLSKKEQDCVRGVFYPMQITGPEIALEDDGDESWVAEESDNTGVYRARYTRLSSDELFKEKLEYISLNTDDAYQVGMGMTAKILSSSSQIKADQLVPQSIFAAEQLELRMGDVLVSRSDTQVNIERVDAARDETLAVWKWQGDPSDLCMELFQAGMDEPVSDDAWEEQRLDALRKKYKDIPVEEVYGALQAVVRVRENHAQTIPAIHALRDYLLVNPDEALALPDMIKDQQADDQLAGRIILALELAGTSQAQDALVGMVNDDEQRMNQRIQSIVACGGIQEPAEDFAEELWKIHKTTDADPRLRDTSILSLGTVAGSLQTGGRTNEAWEIRNRLLAQTGAPDVRGQELALLALDNMGGLEMAELSPHLRSADATVRAAAVQHLRHETNEVTLAVATDLMRDADPDVRMAALTVLENVDETVVQAKVREQLVQEKQHSVKRKLIQYLARRNQESENVELLRSMARSEQDVDLKKELWRAVYRPAGSEEQPAERYYTLE